jgi:hypothetical protein
MVNEQLGTPLSIIPLYATVSGPDLTAVDDEPGAADSHQP